MNAFTRGIAVVFLLLTLPPALAAAVIAEAPWVREAPPTSTVLAAYLVLKNTGDTAQTVTAVSSPDFRAAEIHRSIVVDGVAKMRPAGPLQLPPGGSIALQPGGLHLMLFDPKRVLREGDHILLVIHGAGGELLRVEVPVVRKATDGHEQHH